MNDDNVLLFALLVIAVIVGFILLGSKAREARAKLREERDAKLTSIRSNAPDYIWRARIDFERQYEAGGGSGTFGQDKSPLVCFGYRVGTINGLPEDMRRTILEYALAADYDATLPFLPESYRREWGEPLGGKRFKRIYTHLTSMADLRDGRRNMAVAVSHWRSDAAWFRSSQRHVVEKYRAV